MIALAEEERDTCPSCGWPKAWCRDPRAQFAAFEAHEETCFATYALAVHSKKVDEERSVETRAATQISARFADSYALDMDAGLGLTPDGSGGEQHAQDR